MTGPDSDCSTTVRGVELAVSRSAGRPTLIWGHGLTSHRAHEDATRLIEWDELATALDLVRYDARGHGESGSTPGPDEYGWDELALDQLALADALNIAGYVAGGASMGCGTALWAAVHAPARIQALVLMIPPTAWETRRAQADLWGQAATVLEGRGVEALIAARAALPPPDPFTEDSSWQDRSAANMRAWDPARLARVFRGAGVADLPSREAIAAISVPTLVLAWSGDPGHPVSTAEALGELITGSEVHVARTADDLGRWTTLTRAFLDRLPPT